VQDPAVAEMAHGYDQPAAVVTGVQIELPRIGSSAAMAAFRMRSEPAPIEPGNFIERSRPGITGFGHPLLPLRKAWLRMEAKPYG
jgi:hypothetical protein